jgi:hypothetical protein
MLDQAYQKTEGGRAEIKARALPLSRSARNLLLVIDATRSARDWLTLVQGCGEADIAFLLEQGLIAGASAATAPARPAAAPLPQLDYQQLYAFLSGQATKQLGLIKGYAFALDVEKCAGLPELQRLALDFVERVQQSKGSEAAGQLRQALGLRA